MPPTKVCVTGAGGFIGSNLVAFLKKKGYWVRAVDIQWPEFRKELWSQADERATLDLRNRKSAESALDHVEQVYHLASDMGGVGYFHSDKDETAARNNMRIDLNVLDALKGQRLFYSSSACSYGVGEKVLKEEDWGKAPADQLYGEEKRMMTLLCGKQPNARVGLFHTIYGPYQEYEGERMKFPTAITRKILLAKHADWPEVEIWGDGKQVRTFCYIDEALERIYRIMSSDSYHGPVNIGSEEEVTIREIADELCKYAGIQPHYVFNTDKPTGVKERTSDNSKFDRLYQSRNTTPTNKGFRLLYDWLKNQIAKDTS